MPPDPQGLPDFPVEGYSPTYDLSTTSFWSELLRAANLKIKDDAVEKELRDAADVFIARVASSIGEYKAGFLVRVNILADESGGIVIPGGELLTPVGLGREPIDALAEFYLRFSTVPRLDQRDLSFFFWFTK